MTKLLFIRYDDNWADEMDVEGWRIYSTKDWEECVKDHQKMFETHGTLTYSVGTNEEIEYESFNEWRNNFSTKSITTKEVEVLKKFFGRDSHGFFANMQGYYDE